MREFKPWGARILGLSELVSRSAVRSPDTERLLHMDPRGGGIGGRIRSLPSPR